MVRLRMTLIIMVLSIFLSSCDQLSFTFNPPPPPPPPPQAPPPSETPLPPPSLNLNTWTPTPPGGSQETPTPAYKREPVWVLNEEDKTLIRVDPSANSIISRTKLDGTPSALAVGEGAVWVIEEIDENHSNILRVESSSGVIAAKIPITYGAAKSIAAGEGSVWVGIAEPAQVTALPKGIDYDQPGGVVRIDPKLNQVSEYIKTKAVSANIIIQDKFLWVLEWLFMLTRVDKIDPASKAITPLPSTVDSSDYIQQFSAITKNASGIWAAPLEQTSTFIFRIDPNDGKVTTKLEVGNKDVENDRPIAIASDETSIWVAMRSGDVLRVNPADGKVANKIKTGNDLSSIFLASGSVWAASRVDAMLYQIDPAANTLTASIRTGSKPRPTPTPSQTPMPTPLSEMWNPCPNTYVSHLRVGMNAIVAIDPPIPNRVRVEAKKSARIVGYIEPGEKVEIQTGPSCADGWIWWSIRSNKTGLIGWTAEGDGTDYWLNPSP